MVQNSVRQARLGKSLSQQDLANMVGVTRQTIGLIENHKYNPTIILCLKIADTLEQPLDKLFWLGEEQSDKKWQR